PHPVGDAFADQCAHKEDYTNPKTGKPTKAPDGKPYKIGCIFTPYNSKQYVAYAPGTEGGEDWTPSSFNPNTHFQYVCGYNGNSGRPNRPTATMTRQPARTSGTTRRTSRSGSARRV